MKSQIVYCLIGCLFMCAISPADSIDTFPSWDTSIWLAQMGESWGGSLWLGENLGQTFQVTSDATLDSLTVGVWDYDGLYAQEPCRFNVCIMEWNGEQPTGPVLYRSASVVSPQAQSWQMLTVSLGGVFVEQDRSYIAILDGAYYMNGVQGYVNLAGVPNVAAGSLYANICSSPADFSENWWLWPHDQDMAFRLNYTPVPEPATVVLLGLGGMMLRKKAKGKK